ncbi:MAG: DUF4159 domain-containing protein [Salinarimonadaceae bacterium]|nr:MAG: DUF4159 domain-containing protein [Salinarimonadaceae bacterium]
MFGLPLTFAAPLVLAGLVALPAIWLLLRVTPPQPRRIAFPPLKIMADLLARRETPARTPWWLLLLRLVIAAVVILAAAGPVLNPAPSLDGEADAPVLVIVDNGATAAHDWRARSAILLEQGEAIMRDGRPMGVLATAEPPAEITLTAAGAALETLRAIAPRPHLPDAEAAREPIRAFLASHPAAEILWIADGVALAGADDLAALLAQEAPDRRVTVMRAEPAPTLALADAQNAAGGLVVTVLRPEPNGRDAGVVRAADLRGLSLAEAPFAFESGELETQARFDLPIELRNAVARIEIMAEGSAAAVALLDESSRRRRVGVVAGTSLDLAQPLLAPTFYIERALTPYAEIREGRGGSTEAVERLLDEQVSVLVLADIGLLPPRTQTRVTEFVEGGGLLLRFAGPRLSAEEDTLTPVRLRLGGRNLGGALSWDSPRTLAPFTRESPFYGLAPPDDLGVTRQILAEPSGELTERTWAALADGTPIVTADRRGEGMIVLFHVTADAGWSNLPLTGLFLDMLRRTLQFAAAPEGAESASEEGRARPVAPRLVLDGSGVFSSPPANARPVLRGFEGRASLDHPPGFYGPPEASLAVNALGSGDRLAPVDLAPLAPRVLPLSPADTVDLRAPLLLAALALMLLDSVISIMLSGHLAAFAARLRRGAPAAGALFLALGLLAHPGPAAAQSGPAPTREDVDATLVTRLAYVVTRDDRIDSASRAGLMGLTRVLAARTALEPGNPVGLDIETDELAFYPILYWPIVAANPLPSPEAMRRIDTFMKNGGLVIFDTRDASRSVRPGGAATPENDYLRRMLASVDVPPLEPLPSDHVLKRTFFILDTLPGRHASGETWVEAIPPIPPGETARPARAGDGVSPLIITSNDLASAWAVGPAGEALFPTAGSDPRQREMAYRAGVNIVMYALTGNYKADQVHVPALLERLGN